MINTNNIFRFLLLISMTITPFLPSSAEPAGNNPVQPVWEAMKPSPDDGFVKLPSASTKLTALIITDNATAIKGETLTFTLESNQSDLHFYWISNGQKSTRSTFIVDTGQLTVGKHRVRVTVTNRKRVQAHASLFFNVVEDPESSSDGTNNGDASTPTDNDGKVIELPAVNTDQPQTNTDVASDNGKVVELPVINPDASDTVNGSTNNDTDSESDQSGLSIKPQRQSIVKGGVAVFRSNATANDGYKFRWKFTDQRGNSEQFEISSGNLEVGSYLVHLTTTDKENNKTKAEATLIISDTDNELITIGDYVGTELATLKDQLKDASLQLGSVSERPVEEGKGIVVEQTPKAGSQLKKGASIDVIVGIASKVTIPDLLGEEIADARQQLDNLGLKLGNIIDKIDTNAIGLVIEQSPKAEVELERGASVDLVVGKSPPKPLTVKIQPASMIVEQGKAVEFSAIFVDPEVDTSDLSFSWTSANFDSEDRVFTIDTSSLSSGKYSVELLVKNTSGQEVSSAAVYEITPKTTEVPDLSGNDIDAARSLLEQADLKLGEVQQRQNSDLDVGQVLEQTPSAGERIASGKTVNITVASAKKKAETTIFLTVDKKTIKLGEAVTFQTKIEPVTENKDIHYVYTMNAEKVANVRSMLQWKPKSEGIYSVAVTAYDDAGILAKSAPLSIDVAAAWELPVAKILPEMQVINQGENAEFVSTATYDLNSSLNYEWSSDTKHGGSKKQFGFDTTEIEPGTYTITLNVEDDKNKKSSATAMLVVQASVSSLAINKSTNDANKDSGFSNSQLTAQSVIDNDEDSKIQLSVSRRFVSTDTAIKIKVSNDGLIADGYYFEPGDEQNTPWVKTNEIEHTYKDFGTYLVRAAVKQGEKTYYSNTITIWVWSSTLLFITAGIGLLIYVLMWWWTKFIPKSKKISNETPVTEPVVIEEQVPLSVDSSDESDIVTDARQTEQRTVISVLKRAVFQFVLGVVISILVLYVILKSINLI